MLIKFLGKTKLTKGAESLKSDFSPKFFNPQKVLSDSNKITKDRFNCNSCTGLLKIYKIINPWISSKV